MTDAILTHIPGHFELVYVGPRGTNCYCFGYQPTTDDIAYQCRGDDRYCVQLIGETFEVYDLSTLKRTLKRMFRSQIYTIGIPVFSHKDPDAAIMWALMNL